MPEVFTQIVNIPEETVAPRNSVFKSQKMTADDDMYIIGWNVRFGYQKGGTYYIVCQRGATNRWKDVEDYNPIKQEDDVLFLSEYRSHDSEYAGVPSPRAAQFLPEGVYRRVAKGERIYVHTRFRNVHASSSYRMSADCIIYYTKKKPE